MQQPPLSTQSNRFSPSAQQCLAIDAIRSNNLSATARAHDTSRRTVYRYKEKASTAINKSFDDATTNDVLYTIPVTKQFIEASVIGLFGICKASERDIQQFSKSVLDYSISIGKINNILNDASDIAHAVNTSYDLSDCNDSTSDECFHRGDPVLAVADIDSKFCFMLEREDELDHEVWGMYLDELKKRGYAPNVNVMDGGSQMKLAYQNALPETTLRYDHFHILQTVSELMRFLDNKRKSSVTEALKAYNKQSKYPTPENKAQWEALSGLTEFYENIFAQAKILTNWLQYDVLQLPSNEPDVRSMLFDFIVNELRFLGKKHPHRINALVTTLVNNKNSLLDASRELNDKFKLIANEQAISVDTVWDICYLNRFSSEENYVLHANELDRELGDKFDEIEDAVIAYLKTTYRTSSVIEGLYSRVRPYLDKRKGFKSKRYALILFMLNHLPIQRTANPANKGKSTAEVFTKQQLPDWMTLLGLSKLQKAA